MTKTAKSESRGTIIGSSNMVASAAVLLTNGAGGELSEKSVTAPFYLIIVLIIIKQSLQDTNQEWINL